MSEVSSGGAAPEWDVGDRMRKALREAGIGVGEIAEYLGVARTTVSNWINGRIQPSTQTLRLWAMRTGVPYQWLKDGQFPQVTGAFKMTCNLTQKLAKRIALPVAA